MGLLAHQPHRSLMTFRRVVLIALAALGACLLLVAAVYQWPKPADEHAYWLAAQRLLSGQPLYDPTATSITPYAFWYPPIVAQVLAPVAFLVPSAVFGWLWIVLMLGCLWWLAGRDILVALAMCAFPPIAVEFVSRNVHLIIAVVLVLGLRRWGGWFSVGAAIKLAPVLGIPYLALRGRVRDAVVATAFGAVLLLVSVLLGPEAWRQFLDTLSCPRTRRRVRVPAGPVRREARSRGDPDGHRRADRTADRRAAPRRGSHRRPSDPLVHGPGHPRRDRAARPSSRSRCTSG